MAPKDPDLSPQPSRVIRVSAAALDAATGALGADTGALGAAAGALDTATGAFGTAAVWGELVRAGIALGPGRLDDGWRVLLSSYHREGISVTVKAEFGDVGVVSVFSLAGTVGLGVTQRQRLQRDAAGSAAVVGADPVLELNLFRGNAFWDVVRRALPPLDGLRGGPEGPVQVTEPATVPAAVDAPVASVTITVRAHTARLPGPPDAVWIDIWAIGSDQQAYWVPVSAGGQARLARVGLGHVAQRFAWNLSGALDTLARAAAGGAA